MNEKPQAMRDALLGRIYEAMCENDRIFFTCADFGSPVLDRIRTEHSHRFVNVGIAEQNLINLSAGLALEGYTVFAYAIAPFITMRCYEQIRVNLALLSEVRPMNVNLIGVGAGYSYVVSGPTHQCYEDISIMRALPNVDVLSPADHVATAALLPRCLDQRSIKYLRLDAQILPTVYAASPDLSRGFQVLREGGDLSLVATGYMVHTALKVAAQLSARGVVAGVIDLFDLGRYSQKELLAELAGGRAVVTLEEGFRGRGGMDSMIFDLASRAGLGLPIMNIGVEGRYSFELGSRTDLHEAAGIGEAAVLDKVAQFLERISNSTQAGICQ